MKFKLAVFRLTAQERFLLDLLQQAGDGAGHRIDGSADHPDLIHGRGRNPVMQVALRYRGDSLLHGGDVAVDLRKMPSITRDAKSTMHEHPAM